MAPRTSRRSLFRDSLRAIIDFSTAALGAMMNMRNACSRLERRGGVRARPHGKRTVATPGGHVGHDRVAGRVVVDGGLVTCRRRLVCACAAEERESARAAL